ncbi:MAG: sigma-70 factor domain-containing protein [Solirubrobacteraceae bacterium]|jgi:DNA-directed RNA polymerase sigma subunit (sigma70/sigma32)
MAFREGCRTSWRWWLSTAAGKIDPATETNLGVERAPGEHPHGQALLNLKPEGTSDALALFLRDVGRVRLLNAGEEVELAKRIWRGDLDAKARMVESNLRLVVSIAEVTGVDPGGSSRSSSARRRRSRC